MAEADAIAPRRKRAGATKPPPQPGTPDPIEIAMSAAASGKPLPEVARRVLEEQARFLSAQCAELRLRRIGEGVRAALWAILAVAALVVVGLIVAVVVHASRSDTLIVQSFRVPPSLAAKGLTGEVIATQVLDKLADMQGKTESVRAASTYANNWEDDLKIDIPNTGAMTSEVWKVLRAWLGKETRITGEVIETRGGLALTARVGGMPGRRFESPTSDLDKLITDGAELIYRYTQPYRFAMYAGRAEREAERFPILKELSTDPSQMERKWAYSGLSYDLNSRGEFAASVAMSERALRIDPQMAPALSNGSYAHMQMGHAQIGVDMLRRAMKNFASNSEYDPQIAESNRCANLVTLGGVEGDPVGIEHGAECYESLAGDHQAEIAGARAGVGWLRHDPRAMKALQTNPNNGLSKEEASRFQAEVMLGASLIGDPSPEFAGALEQFRKAAVIPAALPRANFYRRAAPVAEWPLETEALLLLGRNEEAAALIARTPLDCYTCVQMRGRVAQALGDGRAADRWFAEAVRQGPRLPLAYAEWGRSLAQRRQFNAAETRLKKAIALAPNWVDPVKYWGDALASQRKKADAIREYDAALKLAPNWLELRRARQRLARAS